ncbi:MAG TPA: TrkH family potassium uptake protein [Thermoanaerobaculia bacterium]
MRATGSGPVRLLIGSFLVLILAGTILLKLPWATPADKPIGWIDALFTATSATCVTGLAVRDTGTAFTVFGQLVILGLIQAGGLGLLTFSIFILALFRGRVSLAQRSIFEQTLAARAGGRLWPILRLVFLFTFATEALGALLLFLRWLPEMGAGRAAYYGIFHSISAFCNAGFGLRSDNLTAWRGDAPVVLTVSALIVLGGLGFFTVYEIVESRKAHVQLSVHSKLALTVSGVLIVLGTVVIWILEAGNSFAGMTFGEQALAALFQSVTTRTAGFNTVDLSLLSPGSLFFMTLLMFVGGSPGSAAGGIKTTTLGVLVATMYSRLLGRSHVNVFRRTLEPVTVRNALTIALGGILGAILALFALILLQSSPAGTVQQERSLFFDYLFETVSALATVGLSTGITPDLTPASRLLVSLLMFLGRLGPLTLASALATDRTQLTDWQYAEEEVMVG